MNDTEAVDAIARALNDAGDDGWDADHFSAISRVLDQVRPRRPVTSGPWEGDTEWAPAGRERVLTGYYTRDDGALAISLTLTDEADAARPLVLTVGDEDVVDETGDPDGRLESGGVYYCTVHHGLINEDQYEEACNDARYPEPDEDGEPRPCVLRPLYYVASHPAETSCSTSPE